MTQGSRWTVTVTVKVTVTVRASASGSDGPGLVTVNRRRPGPPDNYMISWSPGRRGCGPALSANYYDDIIGCRDHGSRSSEMSRSVARALRLTVSLRVGLRPGHESRPGPGSRSKSDAGPMMAALSAASARCSSNIRQYWNQYSSICNRMLNCVLLNITCNIE